MAQNKSAKHGSRVSKLVVASERRDAKLSKKTEDKKQSELLPSDGNDNADISPRVAFLAYN